MYVEFNSFDKFLRFLEEQSVMAAPKALPVVKLDTVECLSALWKPESQMREINRQLGDQIPGLSGKLRRASDIFPVVKVSLKAGLPATFTRIGADGMLHDDVDEARYETWVSANSNFPAGRTDEFSLVSELREKLEDAKQRGLQVSFESERPREWFSESG